MIITTNTKRFGRAMAAVAMLLTGVGTAEALTTASCLAKKAKQWGTLRSCQATETARAVQGLAADPAKCQARFDQKLAAISAQAASVGVACRYDDTHTITVTDFDTGLMWTKTRNRDGYSNYSDVRDADNSYTWTDEAGGTAPNGTIFSRALYSANGCFDDGLNPPGVRGGLRSYCDWRLPSIVELRGIRDETVPGCDLDGGFGGPCIDEAVFGPTATSRYSSSTTYAGGGDEMWYVSFFNGGRAGHDGKEFGYRVRLVRKAW